MGARRRVLALVAGAIPERATPVLVGIDGVDGAGKTWFADDLARVVDLPVLRVSLDDFHRPRSQRYARGRDSPEGFWLDSYDYPAFRERVLAPLAEGGSGLVRTASHDLASDALVDPAPVLVTGAAVVLVDGLFLHRDELVGAWDVSVFLDVPFEVTVARMAVRDGASPVVDDLTNARYVQAQRHYLRTCDPAARATLVVDNTDPAAPTLRPRTVR
ncbi:nucleoside/nucleotide kinase family protein [Cellulomonas edaphi]|uniref:Uridine kinase n=1 Tax=Cellulomonas edaphi TaxID=3053468 RepID=A0ABT7S4G2_9CELL|nr:uridine kinase [Cellulomons edaphi]MDM7830505.1 uridine kinase [Cellulomons edaphi]